MFDLGVQSLQDLFQRNRASRGAGTNGKLHLRQGGQRRIVHQPCLLVEAKDKKKKADIYSTAS